MLESEVQPIKIAISAMGGQGGGVLSDWIRMVGEANGYLAQSTSVPGVAQRTGATIYYLELFPAAEAERLGKRPVLGMTPVPGDVDILIAAELIEAGRAVQRGFVTPDKTTLIATTHRSYTVPERQQMGDGRADSGKVITAVQQSARKCIAFDMDKLARDNNSVISSVLFGALAGTGELPFERGDFEAAIRSGGKAVETNLMAFAASYQRAERHMAETAMLDEQRDQDLVVPENASSAAGQELLNRVKATFPEPVQAWVCEGIRQLTDYQDYDYAALYLDRLEQVLARDNQGQNYLLTTAMARHLALWMAFQDTIRVADQKTRRARFERIREEVKAGNEQYVYPVEFLHPRVEEICDCMPRALGSAIMKGKVLKKILSFLFSKGRKIHTGKLSGYLPLYLVARLRFMRRATYRYALENRAIEGWLAQVLEAATEDYMLAVRVAEAQRLIKGYGSTYERGMGRFRAIMDFVAKGRLQADEVRDLSNAALAGEAGEEFNVALERYRKRTGVEFNQDGGLEPASLNY